MQTRLPPSDIQEEDMTMMHIHRAPHPHCFNSSSIEMHQPIMNASQQHPSLGIDYPLKEIMSPHANDVCKCLNACSLSCIAPTKAHQSYMHSNTSLSSLSDESQYAAVEADLTTIQATNPSASSLTKSSSPT